jgi:hypothetical protein
VQFERRTEASAARRASSDPTAKKRVTIVEQRGLSEDELMEERGKAAWMKIPLRKNQSDQ